MDDKELYEWVEKRIPREVDREGALISSSVGEYETAMFDLLEDAASDKSLPGLVIDMMRDQYAEGDYRDYFEDIVKMNS